MMFPLFDEEVFILCEGQGKGRFLLYCFFNNVFTHEWFSVPEFTLRVLLANLTTYETYWPFGD